MAAEGPRERRPVIWPWLLMPAVVLLVYYALSRVHQHPRAPTPAPSAAATGNLGES